MPKRTTELFVLDVIIAIDKVRRYSKKMYKVDSLVRNEEKCDAVMKGMEIIGEAVNKILQDKRIEPYVKSSWRDIVDFRNILVHEYFGLGYEEIYWVIKNDLPVFEKEMIALFKKLWVNDSMKKALDDMLDYLNSMGRDESVLRLTKLKNAFFEKTKPKKRVSRIKK
jgi:uncharacterized protein with HEPN domain